MKRRYIRCVDCSTEINPAIVQEDIADYCWYCNNYDIEVVVAYD